MQIESISSWLFINSALLNPKGMQFLIVSAALKVNCQIFTLLSKQAGEHASQQKKKKKESIKEGKAPAHIQ